MMTEDKRYLTQINDETVSKVGDGSNGVGRRIEMGLSRLLPLSTGVGGPEIMSIERSVKVGTIGWSRIDDMVAQ